MIYLVFFDVVGVGWVILGVVLIVLVVFLFCNGDIWVWYLIFVLIWIFYVFIFVIMMKVVNIFVVFNLWELFVFCFVVVSVVFFFDWLWGS